MATAEALRFPLSVSGLCLLRMLSLPDKMAHSNGDMMTMLPFFVVFVLPN